MNMKTFNFKNIFSSLDYNNYDCHSLAKYYEEKYNLNQKKYIFFYNRFHNLEVLKKFDSSLFLENNFDPENPLFQTVPAKGLIVLDYDRALSLDLNEKQDLREFQLIAANLIRVIFENPQKAQFLQDFDYFNQILEFAILEGFFEYFNISVEDLLLVLAKYNYIKAHDCAFISYARALVEQSRSKDIIVWNIKLIQKF